MAIVLILRVRYSVGEGRRYEAKDSGPLYLANLITAYWLINISLMCVSVSLLCTYVHTYKLGTLYVCTQRFEDNFAYMNGLSGG